LESDLKTPETKTAEPTPGHPVVIAIGVSVDGSEALRTILAPLRPVLSAAVLIVQHIAPTSPGILSALLARGTSLPVKTASAGEQLQTGSVYVAPPDLHLTVVDGSVGLDRGPKVSFSRPSIDVLFRSVARVCGGRSVGVLLSGGGSDGAAGLAAIRRAGGVTIVQDPLEARVPALPLAGLAADGHRVARLAEIPEALTAAVRKMMAPPKT
jgi:two-component system chemotaxis response regulator CheB